MTLYQISLLLIVGAPRSCFPFPFSLTSASLVRRSSCSLPSWKTFFPNDVISPSSSSSWPLHSSSSSEEENNSDSLDELRRLLDASWNTEAMGEIPKDAEAAAESAAVALLNAMDNKHSLESSSSRLYFIDLLLPQYDITQGDKWYDEVLAVDFCIALAKRLEGRKSSIILRDEKTLQTVKRVLDARARDNTNQESVTRDAETFHDEDNEDDDDDSEKIGDDDYTDLETSPNIDSFRQQLISNWDSEDNMKEERKEEAENMDNTLSNMTAPAAVFPLDRYRLCTMLGDVNISSGDVNMMMDVVQAVALHAQPQPDEDTLIILSAVTVQEMVGVRSLVAKYGVDKHIILVNCKLSPMPKELVAGQTVYSILPLIAQAKKVKDNKSETSDATASSSSSSSPRREPSASLKPPKVVVLRRFPRDWEVFVDNNDGTGFVLAATAPATTVKAKGPSQEWIAETVKDYLDSRKSRRR